MCNDNTTSSDSTSCYCIEYCSSHNDIPRRKHPNRKTFTAGDRFKWSRYQTNRNQESRYEYGYPYWSDIDAFKKAWEIWGDQRQYYKIYCKWVGEPPRFNLKLIQQRRYEQGLKKGIKLPRWTLRSKNSFV